MSEVNQMKDSRPIARDKKNNKQNIKSLDVNKLFMNTNYKEHYASQLISTSKKMLY